MLLVATPSVISYLWGRPLSPDGFTSCHLPSSHQTLPPHLHPHLTSFLVSCLAWRWWVVRQFWRDVMRDWTTTAEQLLSPSLSYLFSSVRLKMAARDGDKPVWPSKHCPLQIPLFIHKLDPLGLRGRLVRSVDPCDVCVCVCGCVGGGSERLCVCMHGNVCELGLNLCAGWLVWHYLLKIRSHWVRASVCLHEHFTHTQPHTHTPTGKLRRLFC